jgi:translation initiation factor 2 subunit 3
MNLQPICNIGTLGSVSDGKSTLVEKLTGIKTQRHSSEKIRNITIKSGYANLKIWMTENNEYTTTNDSDNLDNTNDLDNSDNLDNTNNSDNSDNSNKKYKSNKLKLVNHISIPDLAGHSSYIATMLSSISLMDGAIIVIAIDQSLNNKPQLIQHLAAAKLAGITKIIICMNKIDLVSKSILLERKKELDIILEKYDIKPYIIIPTCFNKKIGIDYLVNAIMELFNPSNYLEKILDKPLFIINRTFDINKPGTNWNEISGGVLGGTLISGKLKVGDEIEIRPGYNEPYITKILSIKTDDTDLDEVIPGGLIGIRTNLDPYYCKNDKLIGNVVGLVGQLPEIYNEILLNIKLIDIFGFIWEPKINDNVTLQIGTRVCDAKLINISDKYKFTLLKPICISDNQHIIICRTFDKTLKIVADSYFS